MTAMQGALSAAERSMRSVFVGNIPYEATEEQLKDIFSEVGPVVSFRLVYDRETGKPKGYGFCEYKDQEMALSAMRNLNGYELNGRALRVDNAASEKSKEELKNLQASLGGPPVESPFGAEVSPDKAPEAISRIIASLPPEQLYEFMTQMKHCIENNPNEARTLLIQNPQLSYALLQAQVTMKIVEPAIAVGMLHGQTGPPIGLLPIPDPGPPVSNAQIPPAINEVPHAFPSAVPATPQVNVPRTAGGGMASRPSLLGERPPPLAPPPVPVIGNQFPDRDPRIMNDHDLRAPPGIDHDMRPPPMMASDKDMRHIPMGDHDFRAVNAPQGMPENRPFSDPRYRNVPGPDMGPNRGPDMGPNRGPDMGPNRGPDMGPNRGPDMGPNRGPDMGPNRGPDMGPNRGPDMGPNRGPDMGPNRGPMFDRPRSGMPPDGRVGFDGRVGGVTMSPRSEDPRSANVPPGRMGPQNPRMAGPPAMGGASPNSVSSPRAGNNSLAAAAAAIAPHDQEKAALIMQVLQLTDQQIAMLHPEQRQSIMVLKEQIARSKQAA